MENYENSTENVFVSLPLFNDQNKHFSVPFQQSTTTYRSPGIITLIYTRTQAYWHPHIHSHIHTHTQFDMQSKTLCKKIYKLDHQPSWKPSFTISILSTSRTHFKQTWLLKALERSYKPFYWETNKVSVFTKAKES